MTATKRIFSGYGWDRPSWREEVDGLEDDASTAVRARRVVQAARHYPVLVLDGFDRGDMLAAGVIARMRRPPRLLVLDPTWKRGSTLPDRMATRAGVRLLDGSHVTYGVLSTFEVASFPDTWGVDRDRVRFLPWHFDLSEDELASPVTSGDGFFAGGDSLRDYGMVLDAARLVSHPITIASRTLTDDTLSRLPSNVTAGPVSRARYDALLRSSAAVVVPLQVRSDRSSGQGTILNAMAHGKLLIVNDAPGVLDYVRPGETALVVPSGNGAALAEAMEWVMTHREEAERIASAGRRDVLARFHPEQYVRRVLDVARELCV